MTNQDLAQGWLRQARNILKEAEHELKSGLWHLAVRRAQESVEMALKALLGSAGIEIPRVHDVGALIKKQKDRFAPEIQKEVDRIQSISRRLGKERETSFYGDEETMIPPDELYNESDAKTAVEDARFITNLIESYLAKDRS